MSKYQEFSNIIVKNHDNKYIVDEFIRYYKFIFSNYTKSDKSSKENYYKLLTIKKVIDTISKYKNKIKSGEDLANIKGIGEKTIGRINEIVKTGKLAEIKERKHQIESVEALSKIYGIGPTKASEFYENYNITNIKELIAAHKKGSITLTHQMELGIKYANSLSERIPHDLIAFSEDYILGNIKKSDKDFIPVICGSYRRNKDFSSDLDILITHKDLEEKDDSGEYMRKVVKALDKIFIIDKLTEDSKTHFQGFASFKNIPKINTWNKSNTNNTNFDIKNNVIRLDIIIVPIGSFYTALLHFTGSAVFNQKMRLHAKSLNMKLSEYGLYKLINNKYIDIPINSEKDIFDALLLKYIGPDKR